MSLSAQPDSMAQPDSVSVEPDSISVEPDSISVEPDSIEAAVRVIRSGGVVLLPTDTVYGLGASPLFPAAVARVFALKRRPSGVNLPIMVHDPDQLTELGVLVSRAARVLMDSELFPGPLTLALGLDPRRAPHWLAGRVEVAVRIPDHEQVRAVLAAAGPLLVTSANPHGAATGETVEEILASLDGRPDLVLDGGPRPVVPSTLVNCRLDPPVVERVGAVPLERIEQILTPAGLRPALPGADS
jgi:L-threonylcarbamoyladenylate synthase